MRKVIGMGETIMDIIFHGEQPTAAVPGGSSFNSIISIGRAGIPAIFLGETGRDEVGRRIAAFLRANHVDDSFLRMRDDIQSAAPPAITADDIVQFGSYYAINPHIRQQVRLFLEQARQKQAILYYDLNYRRTYADRVAELLPAIQENFRLADIVRGSVDDFEVMYGLRDAEEIYHRHIAPFCPLFICTCGAEDIVLCTPTGTARFEVPPVHTVSTIGAGDNFNAGFIYGLVRYDIRRNCLPALSDENWKRLIDCGRRFSANVCASIYNSIDMDFGQQMADEWHGNPA